MPSPSHSLGSSKKLFAHDFRSLGIKDLLDARDQFHVHLAHKPNVFATAVGLYLIRGSDPDSSHDAPLDRAGHRHPDAPARTLLNSTVKDWSWPCILVFVTEWQTLEELRTRARFIQVSAASVQESHPHDILITQEAPNYSSRDEYVKSDGM